MEDLVRAGLDALIGEPARQQLPQWGEAVRALVIGEIRRLLATGQTAQSAAQCFIRHPRSRQPAAARLQHPVARLERLARDPKRVDGAVEARADLGEGEWRHGT